MGIFFSFSESEPSGVRWWFLHLIEHLALPFMFLASWIRDTFEELRRKPAPVPEPSTADKDVADLFKGIYGDTKAMEEFLEKANIPSTARQWMVLAGFDPLAPLDTDSDREAQLKYVVRECRPSCYNGDFYVVDGHKLKEFLLTREARQKLDDDFYMQLLVRVSHISCTSPRTLG